MKERNGREVMWGTRRRQSGGTEEDKDGNAHERVRALRRKRRWEEIEWWKKHKEDEGGAFREERESRVGVVASPLDCY